MPDPAPITQIPTQRFWRVEPRTAEDGTPDIHFKVEDPNCPQEQRDLKLAVERALTVIKALYSLPKDRKKLDESVAKLLALSQVGLVAAAPAIASDALRSFEHDIVEREAGPIKNAYMRKLGLWAAGFGGSALAAYFVLETFPNFALPQIQAYRGMLLVWTGCMIGAWASFATRKVNISFADLTKLEEDRIDPPLRLMFTGILTLVLALIFTTGMADVEVGSFRASMLLSSGSVAMLLGAFAGLGEKALPSAVSSRADQVINSSKAA